MVRFNGEVRFPFPRSPVAGRLSDARFLAACAPGATVHEADERTARWTAPSRFRFVAAPIETTLTIAANDEATTFALANRLPGATLVVNGRFDFAEDAGGTRVAWSAEVVERTGLLKVVPLAVLRAQIEAELAELWEGVRTRLTRELTVS